MQLLPQVASELSGSRSLFRDAQKHATITRKFIDAVKSAELTAPRDLIGGDRALYLDEISGREDRATRMSVTTPGSATAGDGLDDMEGRPLCPEYLSPVPVDPNMHIYSYDVLFVAASGALAYTATTHTSIVKRMDTNLYRPSFQGGQPGPEHHRHRRIGHERLGLGPRVGDVGVEQRAPHHGGPRHWSQDLWSGVHRGDRRRHEHDDQAAGKR